jgi:mannosylglycerate hydrolase
MPSVAKVLDGPLGAKYRITYDFALPASSGQNDRTRSEALTVCQIVTEAQLRKNSPLVEFTTMVTNRAKDHRLRVLFPSGIQTDFSHAEGQFDVLTRPVRPPVDWRNASPFYPQQSWVDVNDGKLGLTIINKGLTEYELYDDSQRTLALTLLRCVGRLSGGGESPAAQKTPGAQCLGTYAFQYAMYPHAGTWEDAEVWKTAHQHNVPVRTIQTDRHAGDLPGHLSFMRLEPANLVLSAVKKSERADSIIIRCYNTIDKAVEGKVSFPREVKTVNLVNLNEEFQRQLASSTNIVKFPVGPKQIVTLEC